MSYYSSDVELPVRWAVSQLGELVEINSVQVDPSATPKTSFNYVAMENVEKGTGKLINFSPTLGEKIGSSKNAFKVGDVLYGKLRPYLRKTIVAPFDGVSVTDLIALRPRAGISPEFIKYFLLSPYHMEHIELLMAGIRMPRIRTEDLLKIPIPTPPSAEQRRIVAKLDELFARVEACRERLKQVPRLFKEFRQSVLTAACSGRLTADWREANHVTNSWEEMALAELATKITDGEHLTPKRSLKGKYLLSARNIQNGSIALDDVDYVEDHEFARLRKRCDPSIGDVLLSCSGTVGRAALVDRDDCYVMVRSAAMIRPKKELLHPTYLMYALQSPFLQSQILTKSSATAQANIFLGAIKSLLLPVPSLPEQHEIVRCVEALFKIADAVEEHYRKAQERLQKLPQAILAKAFRGELVPQDPNDEPASTLLERIRQERAQREPSQKKAARSGKLKGKGDAATLKMFAQ